MATILLSAAGAAIGGSMGGTFLGLSMTAAGRFAGAALGRAIDQRLMGQGSDVVETGRVERLRLTGSGEGDAIARVYGRMRVAGHVIWASEFSETVTQSGGGKGAPARPKTREYSYSVNVALALCEGEITSVGRIWADGAEVSRGDLNLRIYKGGRDQQPDPKMEAIEGTGQVPAYRGTAYVVFEDLDLGSFGNRVPQFTFEVTRPSASNDRATSVAHQISGVAMMPGSGEYTLATTPVHLPIALGETRTANVNTPSGLSDFETSVRALVDELPNCQSTSLIVSWFGNDLRCGSCEITPKVEQKEADGTGMLWSVAGLNRNTAGLIAWDTEDRPVYGGTPSDASVIEAITHLRNEGMAVMYYPFILMDQQNGNDLPDPWSDGDTQPAFPWRGHITLSEAPGRVGSPDGTAAVDAEIAAFFGGAAAADFHVSGSTINYSGPADWGYRRFILHNAALCVAAGGVDSFCIGSEMRGLTRIRGTGNAFVAVAELRALAAEVRTLMGPKVKIGYAADWTEYFGYHPQDGSGDVYFNLDPLWADENIDFIGIDNYMPLSDWRDEEGHLDHEWGEIYNPAYLRANIAGGEGYDWYYHSAEARAAQIRTPITDGEHGEPWIYRNKDIRNWWGNAHHERVDGVRVEKPTAWVPQSKPVWFTELGCAAVDKGTNQPNKFLDPKSSESRLPYWSDGRRDELIQRQYLGAMHDYWNDAENNPLSAIYDGPMIDLSRAHVWAWDARPYPFFPNNRSLWSDGANYAHGHWISGRMSSRSLASVVEEICERAGVRAYDTSRLYGYLRGYTVQEVSDARAALQPLMLRYGFDAVEREGRLQFIPRNGRETGTIDLTRLAVSKEIEGLSESKRSSEAELAGRVRLRFVQADRDFDVIAEEAVLPDSRTHAVSTSEVPLVLTRSEGRQTVERWLSEARVARDTMRFALPPSMLHFGVGDVLRLNTAEPRGLYRVDQIEYGASQLIEAVRIEAETYKSAELAEDAAPQRPFVASAPVFSLFLDLPQITGAENPVAPYLAVTAKPWPGVVALYSAPSDEGYTLNHLVEARATIGQLQSPLFAAPSGLIDRGAGVTVCLASGRLNSISDAAFLAGGNLAAVGDGSPGNWELIQFRDAELIDHNTYLLGHRLRGQLGSEVMQPQVWSEGTYFVLLDSAPSEINLTQVKRNLAQHYRIGSAQRGYDDPSYRHHVEAFEGVGLRPYSPCHLRAIPTSSGDLRVHWIRRTRVLGDSWDGVEVPLGEESESYLLRVLQGNILLREKILSVPEWTYTASEQTRDGVSGACEIQIAQISAIFGPGGFARITVFES